MRQPNHIAFADDKWENLTDVPALADSWLISQQLQVCGNPLGDTPAKPTLSETLIIAARAASRYSSEVGMTMVDVRKQAVTGLVPPQLGEALIRETYPSVAAHPAAAGLGRALTRTIIGAPLAWLMLAPLYFGKVLPLLGRRYTLTNRRLMIRKGVQRVPSHEVALSEIDDVRVQPDANSAFFRAANLEILSQGKVILTLPGVPEPESFRHAILNACHAWAPKKAVSA